MKRNISEKNIIAQYDKFNPFWIHSFDKEGKRISSCGCRNPFHALKHIVRQTSIGRQIVITDYNYEKSMTNDGLDSSSFNIKDYENYKIDFEYIGVII